MTLNDLEPQNRDFSNFWRFRLATHIFQSELRIKLLLLLYCMLYTDCQSGRTAATARHVSFAQRICFSPFSCLKWLQFTVFYHVDLNTRLKCSNCISMMNIHFTRESSYCFSTSQLSQFCLSDSLFVCLSHGWISQKRRKLGSPAFHRWLPRL